MNWDNLRIILEIARSGSLTAAAFSLRMDQSTVGRKLNAIEADLGAILFVRSKSGFVPTEPGTAAITRAKEVERSCDLLRDELGSSKTNAVGLVRLVGNAWTLQRLAEKCVSNLLQENPLLTLHLVPTPPPAPIRGDSTISLWFEAPPNPTEFSTPLGTVPYAVYRSSSQTLAAINWVQFHDDTANRPEIERKAIQFVDERERIRMTATDAGLLLAAVRSGVGKGLLPMCLAENDTDLVRVTQGPPEFERILHMHLNPDTVDTKRTRATIEWLRDSFDAVFGSQNVDGDYGADPAVKLHPN